MKQKGKNVFDVETIADVREALKKSPIKQVNICITDLDGVWRSKVIPVDYCINQLKENQFPICDLILAWNPRDIPYPVQADIKFTSYSSGFPDVATRAVPKLFSLPFAPETAVLMLEFSKRGKTLCPRRILKRVCQQLEKKNLHLKVGLELEFWIFGETLQSIKERGYKNISKFSEGNYTFSANRSIAHAKFYNEIFDFFNDIGITLVAIHTETGPGAMEIAIEANNPLEIADQAILVKNFMKILCAHNGLCATFIAKWSAQYSGSGGHIHYSLWDDKQDNSLFFDEGQEKNMGEMMHYAIGGQMATMKDFMVLNAPNINSYARLSPYHFCPCTKSWGFDNRTTAIRALLGSEKSQRLEYRIPGADANPYLSVAGVAAATLHGITNKLKPPAPCLGSAYDNEKIQNYLPTTLKEAADRFLQSKIATNIFGREFVEHYAKMKQAEAVEYAQTINNWQLERYLDYT